MKSNIAEQYGSIRVRLPMLLVVRARNRENEVPGMHYMFCTGVCIHVRSICAYFRWPSGKSSSKIEAFGAGFS